MTLTDNHDKTGFHDIKTELEVSNLLSAGQLKMLNDAHISLDWTRVKRFVEITSSDWQIRAQPSAGKLTLELWEWPGAKVLELSTKVSPEAGPSTYSAFRQLLKTKRLGVSPDQHLKTTITLEAITHAAPD